MCAMNFDIQVSFYQFYQMKSSSYDASFLQVFSMRRLQDRKHVLNKLFIYLVVLVSFHRTFHKTFQKIQLKFHFSQNNWSLQIYQFKPQTVWSSKDCANLYAKWAAKHMVQLHLAYITKQAYATLTSLHVVCSCTLMCFVVAVSVI